MSNLEFHEMSKTIDLFKERFSDCHDSLLFRVEAHFVRNFRARYGSPHAIRVTIGSMDLSRELSDRWVNLVFVMEGVTEFIILKGMNYGFAVIFSLDVHVFQDEVMLSVFGGDGSLPKRNRLDAKQTRTDAYSRDESPDYTRTDAYSSDCTIVAKRCLWYVTPYDEPDEANWEG